MICASFKDTRVEWDFLRRPDYTLKYSILMAWFIGNCLVFIQIVTIQRKCPLCIVVDIFTFFYLTILLCISWYKKYCHWMYRNDETRVYGPYSCKVFHLFEGIQQSMSKRILLYLSILGTYFLVVVVIVVGIFFLNRENKIHFYSIQLFSV